MQLVGAEEGLTEVTRKREANKGGSVCRAKQRAGVGYTSQEVPRQGINLQWFFGVVTEEETKRNNSHFYFWELVVNQELAPVPN